ncbi:MAG: bifunctional (p)ppGpp synthetase/guanosine-3',5'-bis(diphosphate) 3'-pyrophosphohydrolase [Chloroflexia bacterium]|nr:bifunctional (p)ppGpp synthetase/guanosine-3',5'-bis(diphosphate) 3'-pyrophosphohydrolase [Chloroflexia bacterium]
MPTINTWNREKYIKAWKFATKHHTGQKYGGSEPEEYIDYINHIGMVCMEVIWALKHTNEKYDADLAIQCAILHDTIEDTEATFDDIKSLFGEKVANGVMALSKNEQIQSKAQMMTDSLQRIKKQGKEVWMVKLADRISNLNAPPFYWDNNKKIKYLEEAKLIYNALHTANVELAERLNEKITNYSSFIQPG